MKDNNGLPEGWEVVELHTLTNNYKKDFIGGPFGSNLKATEYVESGLPIIRLQNVQRFYFIDKNIKFVTSQKAEQLKSHTFNAGDLVITKLGAPLGKCAIVPEIEKFKFGIISSDIVRLRVNENKIDKRFVLYLLNSSLTISKLMELTKGTTRPRVTLKEIRNLSVPLAPIPEQKRITQKLDNLFQRIDKAISLLKTNIEAIPTLKASILSKAFKGQLFGGVAIGKNGLPEGWEISNFKEITILKPKKSEVKDIEGNVNVTFLPMKDLKANEKYFIPKQEKPIGEVYKGYTYFQDGDVLLAKVTPCFENGKAGIAQNLTNGIGFGSSEYHVIRPSELIIDKWIYYLVATKTFKEKGKKEMTGSSGLKRVPVSFLESYPVPLPLLPEQKRITHKLDNLFQRLDQTQTEYQQKLNSLEALKSSILDQAFKGKL